MMRLLVVGSFKPDTLETYYVSHLKSEISEIYCFPALDIFHDYYYQSWLNKIRFRLGMSKIHNQINRELIRMVKDVNPDIIWVFRGMEIYPDTLAKFKKKGIFLMNFNPDHPYIYNRGTGNSNVKNGLKHYHLHFCYDKNLGNKINRTHHISFVHLPFGYELSERVYEMTIEYPEILKTAFIGTYDLRRKKIILELLHAGIEVDVFGNGWESNLKPNSNLRIFSPVEGEDFWIKTRQYRVQINIYKKHNYGSHNRRTFEVPAVGGILLEPYQSDVEAYFTVGKEIFTYSSLPDLIEKVRMLLGFDPEISGQIRNSARSRSIKGKYGYEHRSKIILSSVNKVKQGQIDFQKE